MMENRSIIFIHQIIFQGMFFTKNIILRKKTGKQIRGNNREATFSIAYFNLFIVVALTSSTFELLIGEARVLTRFWAMIIGSGRLLSNLIISAAALVDIKDSWRVGILMAPTTSDTKIRCRVTCSYDPHNFSLLVTGSGDRPLISIID